MKNRTTRIDEVARALRARRRDLGVSRRELGECAEVSPATIERLERGVRVTPANVTRIAAALAVFEFYSAPQGSEPKAATLEDELVALVRVA